MIYADNAATTKLDIDAFKAMKPYLLDEYGNSSQPYSLSRSAKKALKEARVIVAMCLNASPEEIYFTSGGTEGDNWAIKGSLIYDDRRVTITSAFEHHAILRACAAIERLGYPVAYIQPNGDGIVTPQALQSIITSKAKLVSIMMANNEIGTIQPIKDLCAVAHQNGALFHTDAVQAVGHILIDVQELGVDMLSASAHKFNGPKGIGFMYIRKGTRLFPLFDGGGQEAEMRAGTENVASIVGMATALKKNCEVIPFNTEHLIKLEKILLDLLDNAKVKYRRNGIAPQVPGNMSLSFPGYKGEVLLHRLDLMGIEVSTGSACNSKNLKVSHVLESIALDKEYAYGTIRISLGRDNTEDEVVQIANALIKILKMGRIPEIV